MKLYLTMILVMVFGFLLLNVVRAQQIFYGRPDHLRDLTDLNLLERNDLTASQKTEVLLSWLAAERNSPSLSKKGYGGGTIDSNYLQSQILKTLETKGDPLAISWIPSANTLKDEGVRDGMRLILGFMGDRKQIPALNKILIDNPNPYLRAMAAEDLGILGAVSSLPILERARKDSYSSIYFSEVHEGKQTTFYPVRQVVEETITILTHPLLLVQEKSREQLFASRLANAQKNAIAHNLTASHFIKIANKSKTLGKTSASI